jgi:hypothetical protein
MRRTFYTRRKEAFGDTEVRGTILCHLVCVGETASPVQKSYQALHSPKLYCNDAGKAKAKGFAPQTDAEYTALGL